MKIFFSFKEARMHVSTGPFFISYRNTLFPFWWNLTGSDEWTVFTPGRFDRKRPIPAFQRSSYARDLDSNVVSVFDPLLMRSKDLPLGWFMGVKNVDHGEMLASLMLALADEFSIVGSNFLLYASSGGGLPALRIASRLPGVTVYLTNVQTDPRRYYQRFYRQMARVSFRGMGDEEIDEKYGHRMSSHLWDGDFRLYYAQNLTDQFHYLDHFIPYAEAHRDVESKKNATFMTYEDEESGHGPLPRSTELGIIRSLHQREDILSLLPGGKSFS